MRDFVDEAAAIAAAEKDVRAIAAGRAEDAGTDSAEIEIASEFRVSTVEGQRMFIEAHVVAIVSAGQGLQFRHSGRRLRTVSAQRAETVRYVMWLHPLVGWIGGALPLLGWARPIKARRTGSQRSCGFVLSSRGRVRPMPASLHDTAAARGR